MFAGSIPVSRSTNSNSLRSGTTPPSPHGGSTGNIASRSAAGYIVISKDSQTVDWTACERSRDRASEWTPVLARAVLFPCDSMSRFQFETTSHGSIRVNTVPERSPVCRDFTLRDPRCLSTISRLIHNPSPVPLLPFVVKKGSKIWEIVSGEIPEPVSAIVTMTLLSPVSQFVPSRLRMASRRSLPDIASIAFPIRLLSTCRISPSRHVTGRHARSRRSYVHPGVRDPALIKR